MRQVQDDPTVEADAVQVELGMRAALGQDPVAWTTPAAACRLAGPGVTITARPGRRLVRITATVERVEEWLRRSYVA